MRFSSHTTQLAAVMALWMGLAPLPGQSAPARTDQAPAERTAAKAAPAKATAKKQPTTDQRKAPQAARRQAVQATAPVGVAYAHRPEAMRWADEAAARLDLPVAWVRAQIGQARRLPVIERLILPPATVAAKNWAAYRSRFIEPRRIEAGLAFWQRHQAALARAEQTYGVPASLIVGVIGVETLYGQHLGQFRVLDALATLAFDFPSAHPRAAERQAFFQSELDHFLRLTERGGMDPLSLRGSYAGAMGLPQFMPSSWRRYAVDFDEDGRIDLFNNPTDVIGSVAHYFRAFDWKPGMPTHYPVTLVADQNEMDALLAPDILPSFSVATFQAKGARLEGSALDHPGPLALIELRNGQEAPSYVAGTENFYAVTRYNWSSYYAMAVIELGQAVAERMNTKR